jgi:hypothetical protein
MMSGGAEAYSLIEPPIAVGWVSATVTREACPAQTTDAKTSTTSIARVPNNFRKQLHRQPNASSILSRCAMFARRWYSDCAA